MSKWRCWRCRMPAPKVERHLGNDGLWEKGDGSGKWLCLSCIVLLVFDAEVREANHRLDEWVERQSRRREG